LLWNFYGPGLGEPLSPQADKKIRAADAKEVGVGNPAEETCCYPNDSMSQFRNILSINLLNFNAEKGRQPGCSPYYRLYAGGFWLKVRQ